MNHEILINILQNAMSNIQLLESGAVFLYFRQLLYFILDIFHYLLLVNKHYNSLPFM
jgi:hypothetical protein